MEGLYYPFSRCMDSSSLKQMLLIFDSISFIDPIEDLDHRKYLFGKMAQNDDRRFANYASIHDKIVELQSENFIKQIKPNILKSTNSDIVLAAAISDIEDEGWMKLASNPMKYAMPFKTEADRASWQVFFTKISEKTIDVFEKDYNRFLIRKKTDQLSLDYAAGSALALNLHINAAEELGISPITDSPLHHRLFLKKIERVIKNEKNTEQSIDIDIVEELARNASIELIRYFVPKDVLETVSFEEVIEFRESTKKMRNLFIAELVEEFQLIKTTGEVNDIILKRNQIVDKFKDKLTEYQNNIKEAQRKIWKDIDVSKTLNETMTSGGLTALLLQNLGQSPGLAIIASILPIGLKVVNSVKDVELEKKRLKSSATPTITYLSTVRKKLSS